jgi:hypothetical protein
MMVLSGYQYQYQVINYQNFKTLVKENQTTIAGETLIAKI